MRKQENESNIARTYHSAEVKVGSDVSPGRGKGGKKRTRGREIKGLRGKSKINRGGGREIDGRE